ncbi:MAG TPA: hypothetical protein VG389_09180 [Myxococcota bacterium]|nr:hypothetical protein [Myxococcota bacterium]
MARGASMAAATTAAVVLASLARGAGGCTPTSGETVRPVHADTTAPRTVVTGAAAVVSPRPGGGASVSVGAAAGASTGASASAAAAGSAPVTAAALASPVAAAPRGKDVSDMRTLADVLIGEDLVRAAEAREALVGAGAAAVPALLAVLKRTAPKSAARMRVVATAAAIAAEHPEGSAVLRAAGADAANGDAAVALALTRRPADLRAALTLPHFAERVGAMSAGHDGRLHVGGLIAAYVAAWKDVGDDVRRARKGARGAFAKFLGEIVARATTGKSTGWPPETGGFGSVLSHDDDHSDL